MSGRSWNHNAEFASNNLLIGALGFITTLIGTNPALATLTGFGGLTGPDSVAGVANSGPSFAASITKTANAGEYLVTLRDGYRGVWYADAVVLGPVAGPGDGVHAQVCVSANQGSGNTVPGHQERQQRSLMPKDKGTLIALLGLGKSKAKEGPPSDEKEGKAYSKVTSDADDDDEEEMTNEGASFDAAAESLGQQLNVPQGKRDQFKATLKEAIYACVRGHDSKE